MQLGLAGSQHFTVGPLAYILKNRIWPSGRSLHE
jgi:hypothetical protein